MKKLTILALTGLIPLQIFAGPMTISNPSFEDSTVGPDSGSIWDTVIDNWFMENHDGSDFTANNTEVAQRRNENNMPTVPDGDQWANLNQSSATAGIYQAVGTYSEDWAYTFNDFTVSQRSNQPFVGVTVAIYAGDFSGENNTPLNATFLDSETINQNVFSAAGVAENYVVPSFTLNSGNVSALVGETLWLRISTTGEGHHLVDNLNVTAIPEPSTILLLGITLGSLAIFRRRR
ncbi:MAG: PEP-CTERM sorting domain-containing protein [Verrucomicrobia bacterium]|nr:PEP-CTERM sorting domain-containing protein [Verrucomicrobiota bacterium]MCH8512552.1 PEP-CTERM sorting domain-containing protein [Kiritimatiellia bacterium]